MWDEIDEGTSMVKMAADLEDTPLQGQPCGVLKCLLRLHGTNKRGQLGRGRARGWAAHRRASMRLHAPAAHEGLQLLEVLVPQRGWQRRLWLLLLRRRRWLHAQHS